MITSQDFDSIKPYENKHVEDAVERILQNKPFVNFVTNFFQTKNTARYLEKFRQVNTIYDFQKNIVIPFVKKLVDRTTNGVYVKNLHALCKSKNYLFISNHRDIVLDSALLNYALMDNEYKSTQIAIGSNLLIKPWITDLVKLNKSFIVERNVSRKQSIKSTKILSQYIRNTIVNSTSSIWLAQREGRAKNGFDKTQQSLLKMLNLSGKEDIISNFYQLNIMPVSISYEIEPCDFYKAKELYLQQSSNGYTKTSEDDLKSMFSGLITNKGKICLHFGEPINNQLNNFQKINNSRMLLNKIVSLIDYQILSNYYLFPNNYIAYDILNKQNIFFKKNKYTSIEKNQFIKKMKQKIKIKEAEYFFEHLFLPIYANPVFNKIQLKKSLIQN